jgi:hypothetical protein
MINLGCKSKELLYNFQSGPKTADFAKYYS